MVIHLEVPAKMDSGKIFELYERHWCRLTIGSSVTTHQIQSPTRVSTVVDHVVDTPSIHNAHCIYSVFRFQMQINGGLNFA